MSIPDDDKTDAFFRWVEETVPLDTEIRSWFAPPPFVAKTIMERVEPYASQYDELHREHPSHWTCPECGGEPDEEFYQPTPRLVELEDRLAALYALAFREVPNPFYDEEKAREWAEKHWRPYNTTTIEVGQSYAPTLHPEGHPPEPSPPRT